jgi:hypothetical protein
MEVSLLFFRVITGVGDCIVAELQATPESGGVGPKFRAAYPVFGEIAQDGCNCDGQLAISIQLEGQSSTFPTITNEVPRGISCHPGRPIAQIAVQLDRCQPAVDVEKRLFPTPAQLRAAALMMHADKEVMNQAIICCLSEMKRDNIIRNFTYPQFVPIGPSGNCGANLATFWVQ